MVYDYTINLQWNNSIPTIIVVASNDRAFQSVYQEIQCLLMFSNNQLRLISGAYMLEINV